jgi:hypothetical protein
MFPKQARKMSEIPPDFAFSRTPTLGGGTTRPIARAAGRTSSSGSPRLQAETEA